MKAEKPRQTGLSIIVAAPQFSSSSLENCLKNILANKLDGAEVIVAAGGSESSLAIFVANYPEIKFLQAAQGARATLPMLLAAGLRQATGEIIAMTDTSCVVAAGWVSAIFRAHQFAVQAEIIGGAVEMFGQKNLVDWAAYFCDYSEFMLPLETSETKAVPGNNISFKRALLADSNEFAANGFWKTHWCQKMREKGIRLKAEPSILVYFAKSYDLLPFLTRRFNHGRCFAGMRCRQSTLLKRMFYLFGSLCLPFIFLPRVIQPVLAKKRLLKELFFSFPIILLAIAVWSFGETCGYLAGAGKSCDTIC